MTQVDTPASLPGAGASQDEHLAALVATNMVGTTLTLTPRLPGADCPRMSCVAYRL